jgi:formate dehydrogenase subunit delta
MSTHAQPGAADKLVHKANQIARFFATQPRGDAVAATADHLMKFWEPRMRAQMLGWLDEGAANGLEPVAREAFEQLRLEISPPLS